MVCIQLHESAAHDLRRLVIPCHPQHSAFRRAGIHQKIHDLMDGIFLIRADPEQQVHLQRLHKIRFQPCALIRFVLRIGRERIRFTPLGFIPLSLISS